MEARDLCVLYVGQGIGRTQKRTALDRLTRHSTLQRILAETQTFHPDHEILLLLYRFEHGNVFASNGGDMTVDASATHEEDLQHLSQLSNVHLGRGSIVSLAEAGLIRYFQPQYNVQLKSADFTAKKKITVLTKVLNQGITGLIVEIGSGNLNSRLFTPSAPPFNMETLLSPEALRGDRLETNELKQQWAEEIHAMAHTHIAKFPLTSPDERDTFLHGTKWVGEEERTPI
ncbi:hypothetical protein C266_20974 [Pandoraea sp. SD6-2]|nr:hypothetical protein C266_20974 [Pandoraea sp. SD6-2]